MNDIVTISVITICTYFISFIITLPILLIKSKIKLRWFIYFSIYGKPHPDHIAMCLKEIKQNNHPK